MTDSEPFDVTADLGDSATVPDASRSTDDVVPGTIGRYRVDSVLGQGGFGVVYLAYDDALNRRVAIKVPNERLIKKADQAALYLEEARAVARLDHPCIVPVFDIGTADEFPCFVVSKYIDGHSLAQVARESGLAFRDTAGIVASVADGLHFGHQKGIIHRDVKPANILLDRAGKPFLVDYGLALQDRNPDDAFRCAGTPTYMSPEQARGEGHRVDGRSDIFSLGVVLYELLVGRRPFRGKTTAEILESVTKVDPRPPRQANDKIPRELERICLKALSRRTTDRYTTALDMAEDLRHFIERADQSVDASNAQVSAQSQQLVSTDTSSSSTQASANVSSAGTPVSSAMPSWVGQPAPQLVPKGLRSFDEHDSDFFLELLPGARDRDGLPDAIRFWKTRIDQLDRDATFAVGLIYGPSGCGKSSFVKAGLLPQLGKQVHAIYVEATADETESRLLHSLRKSVRLTGQRSLTDTIAALRHGDGLDDDEKVVIVIDQFEQWLHARLEHDDHELIDAIRQCDGGRVQCVVMIRDDFWMAATRFMRAVEVSLAEGENSLAVDLFEPRHAKRVLASFGRAFGTLPPDSAQTTRNQTAFLEQAIDDIAQDGKVVCVRLALFAEMMKGREWEPASLQSVGGAEGVGAVFLEETFGARTAPPLHRVHQKAARAVLDRLLPEHGSDIKGHMRSRHELLECSGYGDRVDEFNELIRLLDGELRLITPTDPEGSEHPSEEADDSCYQLAHDYLVPSLRDWLTRKQKETPRGRAELRQEELAALWNAKPERQRLPTLMEWIRLAVFTNRSGRTAGQQKMMSAATRHHSLRLGALVCVLAAAGWGVREYSGRLEASALIDQLLTAEMKRVPGIVDHLEGNGHWVSATVEASVKDKPVGSPERIRAGLLLLADRPSQAGPLVKRLLMSPVSELQIICSRLRKCGVDAMPSLKSTLDDSEESADRRFNAALAIAWHASNSGIDCDPYLQSHGEFVTDQLVDRSLSHPAESALRIELLRPVRRTMIDRLHEHFVGDDAVRRAVATGIARDYVSDLPDALSQFVMEANEDQFAIMYPLVQTHADEYVKLMEAELQKSVNSHSDKTKTLARRQANAAVCLMRLQQPESVWPLLEHQPDPRSRSWFIKRAAQLGVPPELLVDRYGSEANTSSRRALLLAIGNYAPDQVAKASRELTIERCKTLARGESDAGLRSAAHWLLRNWKISIAPTEEPRQLDPIDDRNWYTAAEGHTMIVIDARDDSNVGHVFDIASKEVTIAQVREWYPRKNISPDYRPSEDCACGLLTWYQAIAYCQWLNEQVGIDQDQWCYPEFDPNAPGFKVIEADVSKTGFRLPTNAEWEHACRAGTVTNCFFGESPELLPEYAWSSQDRPEYVFPVGLLKPNDFGLFDMYGNLNEWRADVQHRTMVSVGGGSFRSSASQMTSSSSGGAVPSTRYNSYGMRVARTRTASD